MKTTEERIKDLENKVDRIQKAIEPNGALDIRLRENLDLKFRDILPGIKASIQFELEPIREELKTIAENTVISARYAVSEQERREDRAIALRKAELDMQEQAVEILGKNTDILGKTIDIQLKPAILIDARINGAHQRKKAMWAIGLSILGLISGSGIWSACSHTQKDVAHETRP